MKLINFLKISAILNTNLKINNLNKVFKTNCLKIF